MTDTRNPPQAGKADNKRTPASRLTQIAVAAGLATLLPMTSPAAASAFPTRAITVVVNYGAGGVTDVTVRALAAEVSEILGVPVQVSNRAGGQGTAGPTFVAGQRADGYTIGVTSFAPMAISPHMFEVPFTIDDFDFVAGVGRHRYGIAVSASSPYETADDFIAAAKEQRLTVSASGPPNNLPVFDLNRQYETQFQFIPFPSGAEAITAVIGGHVDAVVQSPTEMMPLAASGQIRILASLSPVRWFEEPDMPTMIELGYDVSADSWLGFGAPKGVDPAHLEILRDAFRQAAESEEVTNSFQQLGMEMSYMTGEEYGEFLRTGYEQMGVSLREAGLVEN